MTFEQDTPLVDRVLDLLRQGYDTQAAELCSSINVSQGWAVLPDGTTLNRRHEKYRVPTKKGRGYTLESRFVWEVSPFPLRAGKVGLAK